jgi:hypothetical protein
MLINPKYFLLIDCNYDFVENKYYINGIIMRHRFF